MTFGALLREHRIAAGLSQNRLARLVGCDPAYIHRFEKYPERHAPSRAIVLGIAVAVNLDAYATDRLLFAAGLAPENDWQAIALDYAQRFVKIDRVLLGAAELPTMQAPIRGVAS